MAFPRRIVPGITSMITRRTLRRTHLLRPDAELNNLFLYCLAVCARRHGIAVHAAVLMSTHEHLVVTDTLGRLPRFLHELHRLLALGIKVLRKWEGAVWDHEKTSVVELRTPQAVLEKIAYVIANPVSAGLVQRAHQWPGITTRAEQIGRACWTARKPSFFFNQDSPQWPAVASLRLSTPIVDIDAARARACVADEVIRLELASMTNLKAKRWRVFGPKVILALSPYGRARGWEPLRARNPTFAVGRAQREAFLDSVKLLRAFRMAHRAAMETWRRGVRDVLFPVGTWMMRFAHGANVEIA
jgi:putative transposase